jgi:hypothetical protein
MTSIKLFENKHVRSQWDDERQIWYFSIVDVVAILTGSIDPAAYWRKLKQRLKAEGNETVTNCHGLKMVASDGKLRMTDVVDTEQLLRLVQSIPSPKAEPFKRWLARVGYERIEETEDPELALERGMETWLKKGYSRDWINQRLKSIEVRKVNLHHQREHYLGSPPLAQHNPSHAARYLKRAANQLIKQCKGLKN